MGFKDLIKDVSDFAQDSLNSIQEEIALKKEEQQRLREEMNRRINDYKEKVMQKLLQKPNDKSLITSDSSTIVSFTKSFCDDLYLPASNGSNSRLHFYPEYAKTKDDISKIFPDFTDQEQFLMTYKDSKEQRILLTSNHLYFKIIFPENNAFYCLGHLNLSDLYSFKIEEINQEIIFLINDFALIKVPKADILASDLLSLKNYLNRLANQNFEIKPHQIHQFILSKLDLETTQILHSHLEADELLVYFAWGLDSINSNKFVACTNKKIFFYDQEISLNKYFYYPTIISVTTQPSTINLLDLSLNIGINPHELTIKTTDQSTTINILYENEAQKVVDLYQRFAKDDATSLLEKLAQLKEAGILSEAEFNAKKEEILKRL